MFYSSFSEAQSLLTLPRDKILTPCMMRLFWLSSFLNKNLYPAEKNIQSQYSYLSNQSQYLNLMIQCFSNIFFFSKEQYFFTLPPEIFLYYSLSLYFRLYSFLKNYLSPVVKKYSILIPLKLVPIPQSYNSKLLECFLLF